MTAVRHLTDIASLTDAAFGGIVDRSMAVRRAMDEGRHPEPMLEGRLATSVFYENSTRTLLSFEIAARRLGAITVNLPVALSSVQKGESVADTVHTIAAQGADYIVMRASGAGSIAAAIEAVENDGRPTSVINAGEGRFGHPTQGLLDVATALAALGRTVDDGFGGMTLAICGDVRHSRVAASAIEAFARLGADIRIAAPAPLLPETRVSGVTAIGTSVDEAIDSADLVMTLRLQRERMADDMELSVDDYRAGYQITRARLSKAAPHVRLMHPGPMNRGVELSGDLADDKEISLITSQVRQGVATRIAVFEALERSKSS